MIDLGPPPSAIENKNLRLLVPVPNLLDQDQIVEDWCSYKIGAGSPRYESPAPILRPHPPKDADEVGVVISQSIVAFSRRKPVTDFQFFWCCRKSTNVFRTQ